VGRLEQQMNHAVLAKLSFHHGTGCGNPNRIDSVRRVVGVTGEYPHEKEAEPNELNEDEPNCPKLG
jgi:hypothetical protein